MRRVRSRTWSSSRVAAPAVSEIRRRAVNERTLPILFQASGGIRDKGFVSRFEENAARIFEAAESAARTGHPLSETTILISPTGGIRIVADSDWPIESLRAHHGAQMVYRVSQRETSVCLEGRAGSKTCLFQTEKPERVVRRLLGTEQRQYTLLSA